MEQNPPRRNAHSQLFPKSRVCQWSVLTKRSAASGDENEVLGAVRHQWEYLRKMERNFSVKPGQPIEMAFVILNSFTEFPNVGKEPVCQKWNGEFRSEYSDRICESPPEVIQNIPVRRNRNGPFHLNCNGNFRNLWHNGKHPWSFRPYYIKMAGG